MKLTFRIQSNKHKILMKIQSTDIKNIIKKIFVSKSLLIFFALCILSACIENEFPDNPYQTITGSWKTVVNRIYYTPSSITNKYPQFQSVNLAMAKFEFFENKRFTMKTENIILNGQYTIENRILYLKYDKNDHSIPLQIISFNESSILIQNSYPVTSPDYETNVRRIEEMKLIRY